MEGMNSALLIVTLSAATAAAAVAVRARLTPRAAPASVRVSARLERDRWHPHVSSGCGR